MRLTADSDTFHVIGGGYNKKEDVQPKWMIVYEFAGVCANSEPDCWNECIEQLVFVQSDSSYFVAAGVYNPPTVGSLVAVPASFLEGFLA